MANDKERAVQSRREYWQKHKEEINQRRREYYQEHYLGMRAGILKRKQKYRKTHKEELAQKNSQYYQIQKEQLKAAIFAHYGDHCACCGEGHKEFLTIDHIKSGGNKHKREIGRFGGVSFYRWIISHGYPSDLRILCYNCNFGRARRGGLCPHQIDKEVNS